MGVSVCSVRVWVCGGVGAGVCVWPETLKTQTCVSFAFMRGKPVGFSEEVFPYADE